MAEAGYAILQYQALIDTCYFICAPDSFSAWMLLTRAPYNLAPHRARQRSGAVCS